MRVFQVSFYLDPLERAPEQLLEEWWSLVDIAECAATAGVEVHVVQACNVSREIARGGVEFHFVKTAHGTESMADCAHFRELVQRFDPDVFHVHGLTFAADVTVLVQRFGRPVLLQDHATHLPRFWRRVPLRRALRGADAVSFCAEEQATPFLRAGLLTPQTRIVEIPESTSRFVCRDRAAARRATGIYGDPAVLCVGHLDRNKDPLTVLEGVAIAADALPDIQLWCCFGSAPLLNDVKRRIERDGALRSRVHLLGRVPHERVELLMNAADLFVSGSHREGSGYSLIEAIACGLPPVVTNIPSFHALTGAGHIGALWPCDDSNALSKALITTRTSADARRRVREHFDAELSMHAVGSKLAAVYRALRESKCMASAV